MSPGHSHDQLIQTVRDEFSRMRAHLFEAVEAAGWPQRQEKGWKGVIRSISYMSQSSLEAELRRTANGGNMAAPGITSQHVQAAYKTAYGPPPEEPAPETETTAAEPQQEAEAKASTSKK
jgi:hypothetical protein